MKKLVNKKNKIFLFIFLISIFTILININNINKIKAEENTSGVNNNQVEVPKVDDIKKFVNTKLSEEYKDKSGYDRYTYQPRTFTFSDKNYTIEYRSGMTYDEYVLTLKNNKVWSDNSNSQKTLRIDYEKTTIDSYPGFGIDYENYTIGYKNPTTNDVLFMVASHYYINARNFKIFDENIYGSNLNIKFNDKKYIVLEVPSIKELDTSDINNVYFTTHHSKYDFRTDYDRNFFDESFSFIDSNLDRLADFKTQIFAYNKATNNSFHSKFKSMFVTHNVLEQTYNYFLTKDNINVNKIQKNKIKILVKYYLQIFPNVERTKPYFKFNINNLEKIDENNYNIVLEDLGTIFGNAKIQVKAHEKVEVPSRVNLMEYYKQSLNENNKLKYTFTTLSDGETIIVILSLKDKENTVFSNGNTLTKEEIGFSYNLYEYIKLNYNEKKISSEFYDFSVYEKEESNNTYTQIVENVKEFLLDGHLNKKLYIKIPRFAENLYFNTTYNNEFNINSKVIYVYDNNEYENIINLYDILLNNYKNNELKELFGYNPKTDYNFKTDKVKLNIKFVLDIIEKENVKIYSYDNVLDKINIRIALNINDKEVMFKDNLNNYYTVENDILTHTNNILEVEFNKNRISKTLNILKKHLPIANKANINEYGKYFNIEVLENKKDYRFSLLSVYLNDVVIEFVENENVEKLDEFSYIIKNYDSVEINQDINNKDENSNPNNNDNNNSGSNNNSNKENEKKDENNNQSNENKQDENTNNNIDKENNPKDNSNNSNDNSSNNNTNDNNEKKEENIDKENNPKDNSNNSNDNSSNNNTNDNNEKKEENIDKETDNKKATKSNKGLIISLSIILPLVAISSIGGVVYFIKFKK